MAKVLISGLKSSAFIVLYICEYTWIDVRPDHKNLLTDQTKVGQPSPPLWPSPPACADHVLPPGIICRESEQTIFLELEAEPRKTSL